MRLKATDLVVLTVIMFVKVLCCTVPLASMLLHSNCVQLLRSASTAAPHIHVRHVTREVMQSLIVSLVRTRLDFGNSAIAGLPGNVLNRLQSVMNAAARVIFAARKFEHPTAACENSAGCAFDSGSTLNGYCARFPLLARYGSAIPRQPASACGGHRFQATAALGIKSMALVIPWDTSLDDRRPGVMCCHTPCLERPATGRYLVAQPRRLSTSSEDTSILSQLYRN